MRDCVDTDVIASNKSNGPIRRNNSHRLESFLNPSAPSDLIIDLDVALTVFINFSLLRSTIFGNVWNLWVALCNCS